MKLKALAYFGLALLALGLIAPEPDSFRTEHGTGKNGAPYIAIFRVPGKSWGLKAHAQQVQNARGQNAGLTYEVQQLGAATTATAASVGAIATDTLTWAVPFADNNYVVACSLVGTATAIPAAAQFTHTATAVTLTHAALTAAAASNAAPGTECTGIHF